MEVDIKYTSPFLNYNKRKTFAQRALANQVKSDSDPFVPKKSGDLRTRSVVSFNGETVTYLSPYAHYQYSNQFSNYTNPGTGPKWDRKAAGMYGDDWAKVYARGLGW